MKNNYYKHSDSQLKEVCDRIGINTRKANEMQLEFLKQSKQASEDWRNGGEDEAKLECLKSLMEQVKEMPGYSEMVEFREEQDHKLMYSKKDK